MQPATCRCIQIVIESLIKESAVLRARNGNKVDRSRTENTPVTNYFNACQKFILGKESQSLRTDHCFPSIRNRIHGRNTPFSLI